MTDRTMKRFVLSAVVFVFAIFLSYYGLCIVESALDDLTLMLSKCLLEPLLWLFFLVFSPVQVLLDIF